MKYLLLIPFFFNLGCGVKGNPQPPLDPPYIGRGEPTFRKASKNVDLKKKNIEDDWKDEEEESEEKK